jgi:hypothetical protein
MKEKPTGASVLRLAVEVARNEDLFRGLESPIGKKIEPSIKEE